jgi:DnaJ-class molecular chaperone
MYDQYGDLRLSTVRVMVKAFSGFDFSGFDFGGGFDFDDVFEMFFGGNPRKKI